MPISAVRSVTPSAKFFIMDDLHSYWQIELAKEDQHLTTFIPPFRGQKHRGLVGFAATGDAFFLRGDRTLQGITNYFKVIDDMLTRCRDHGITINRNIAAALRLNFSSGGMSADADNRCHKSVTYLPSFQGLVNQQSQFTQDIATTAQPLCPLRSSKYPFIWTLYHVQAFESVMIALISPTFWYICHADATRK